MLLVQSIIFLYDDVATEDMLENLPVLSIDIEFAKFMKVKQQNKSF